MFAYCTGKIIAIDGIHLTILVENTGLGLEILTSPQSLAQAKNWENISLWLYHHITEVSQWLFGFISLEEKQLFKNLIKVSGIGGKTALNMLAIGSENLIDAIQNEDDKILSTIPGIGKKTAQKIIVDLKGSINFSDKKNHNIPEKTDDSPLISSLVNMGYDRVRVENIITTLAPNLSLEEKVREAIKQLR